MALSDAERARKDKELSRKVLALERTKAQLLKQLIEVDSSLRLMNVAQQSLRRKSKTDKLIDLTVDVDTLSDEDDIVQMDGPPTPQQDIMDVVFDLDVPMIPAGTSRIRTRTPSAEPAQRSPMPRPETPDMYIENGEHVFATSPIMQPRPQPPPADIVIPGSRCSLAAYPSPARKSSHSSLTYDSPVFGSSFISQGKRRAEDPPDDEDSKALVDYGAISSSKRRYTDQHHLKKEEHNDDKLWMYIKRGSPVSPDVIVSPPSGPSHRGLGESIPVPDTTNYMARSLPLPPQSGFQKTKYYQQVKTDPDDNITVVGSSREQASGFIRDLNALATNTNMISQDAQTVLPFANGLLPTPSLSRLATSDSSIKPETSTVNLRFDSPLTDLEDLFNEGEDEDEEEEVKYGLHLEDENPATRGVRGVEHRVIPVGVKSEVKTEGQPSRHYLREAVVKLGKKKECAALNDATVQSRIATLGAHLSVQTSSEIVEHTFTRNFISAYLGGSPVDTWPKSSKRFTHGYKLMCFNYDFNPSAPRRPGLNGLFMNGRPFEVACKHHGVKYHAFAKQSPSSWQFLGVYTIHHVDEISLEEWLLESDVVRATWSNFFANKKNPYYRKAAYLCRRLGRPVMQAEVDGFSGDARNITAADILEQLDAGHMKIYPWGMKIGYYPGEFQQSLITEHLSYKKISEDAKDEKNPGPKYQSPHKSN